MSLFGTSGARGVFGTEITPGLAYQIANSYAGMVAEQMNDLPFVVGHDQRRGAPELARAAISGANQRGRNVHSLGLVSTGVYTAYVRGLKNAGGILVTGSHMPPGHVGIIPMLPNAHYADCDVTDAIPENFSSLPNQFSIPSAGGITSISLTQIKRRYFEAVREALHDAGALEYIQRDGKPRIFVDPGNGTAGDFAREIFLHFGIQAEMINEDPQPSPNRPSECKPENCREAISRTQEGCFGLGVCYDGDADRSMFIAEDGSVPTDDQIGALFAKYFLRSGQTLVTPVNASRLIEVVCEQIGASVQYCRIGQPPTDTAIRKYGAALAYESAAYKFGFGEMECCYDGVCTTLRLLALMMMTKKSLTQLVSELPAFFQGALKMAVPNGKKDEVVDAAVQKLRAQLSGRLEGEPITIDGVRIMLTDNASVHVRKSGTEPLVRIYVDSQSQEETAGLQALAGGILQESVGAVTAN